MTMVVDLSQGSIAAAHGCTIAAQLGFEVVVVERDHGIQLRTRGPWLEPADDGGVPFLITRQACRIEGVSNDDQLTELVRDADVVVVSVPEEAERFRGQRGTVLVTPFGRGGTREGWQASSQSLFHASGPGYVTPRAPQGGAL